MTRHAARWADWAEHCAISTRRLGRTVWRLVSRRSPLAWALVGLLSAYRLLISPLYGQVCRYHPSCSAYALDAVRVHGAVRGVLLAARRLVRCHPWAAGGYDPVPVRRAHSTSRRASASSPSTPFSSGA